MQRIAATHDGMFHADDVFAGVVLSRLGYRIIRTRDRSRYGVADIVFDQGDEYDDERGRYDHHQRGGAGGRANGIPYAAFGLIWLSMGMQYCSAVDRTYASMAREIASEVDRRLVQVVDAYDTGFRLAGRSVVVGVELPTVMMLIDWCVPTWNEGRTADDGYEEALALAEQVLTRLVVQVAASLASRQVIADALIEARGGIVVLPVVLPWEDVVRKVLASDQRIWYVVYLGLDGTWYAQAVPEAVHSTVALMPFPAAWAALRDVHLARQSDVPDALFCHDGRWIVGARSQAGAVQLARQSISSDELARQG